MKPIIVGHRGVAGTYPENTRSSFLAAAKLGLQWIELDVQPTADRVLVVCHDHELARCSNGQGRIDQQTLADLKTLDFGGWFAPEFQGEQVMTLDELLVFIIEQRLSVNIEIKVDAQHDKVEVAQLTYDALVASGVDPQHILISSFDHTVLRAFHHLSTDYPLAVLTSRLTPEDWILFAEIDAVACNIDYKSLDKASLEQLHAQGRQAWVYTVNDPAVFPLLADVDGLFTDMPEKFLSQK